MFQVVLSHPVVKPILDSPKTEDEHKLFSKLDKVRSLWSSGETPLTDKSLEMPPVKLTDPHGNSDGKTACRTEVMGLADTSEDRSEDFNGKMEESHAKGTVPQHFNENEVQSPQRHEYNGPKPSTESSKEIVGEKPNTVVIKEDENPLFDLHCKC